MPEPLVRADGLRMSFGGVEVVKGVDLSLFPGEVHAIVGENGAGKSTVGKIIAGVHKPTAGSLFLDGKTARFDGPRDALKHGIALIHQEPLTFPDLDVAENIFVGHQPTRVGALHWQAMRANAGEILGSLGVGMNPRSKVGGLSVADQQMVELAAALSHSAKVLIFDETTASLTPKEVADLFVIINRLRASGAAIAFVSHRLDEVREISDRISVMRDGAKVAELLPSESTIDGIVRLMIGRDLQNSTERLPRTAEPLLQARGWLVPGASRELDLDLGRGEIVGLAGLVGAGRTELARTLFGIDRAKAGTIAIDGKQIRLRNPGDAMRGGIALAPEDRQHDGLLLPKPIVENASLALLRKLASMGWLRPRREAEETSKFTSRLRLAHRSLQQPVRELSGGNQQKVVLAKWLMTEPRVLILDEPTRGVDVGAKAEVYAVMWELASRGIAILMISSDLPEVLAMSDRVLVMRERKIVAEFDAATATAELVMMSATGQSSTPTVSPGGAAK